MNMLTDKPVVEVDPRGLFGQSISVLLLLPFKLISSIVLPLKFGTYSLPFSGSTSRLPAHPPAKKHNREKVLLLQPSRILAGFHIALQCGI